MISTRSLQIRHRFDFLRLNFADMMVACIHRQIQSSGGPLPLTIHLLPLFLLRTSPITLNIFTHGFALRIDYHLLKRADVFCLSLIDL